MFSRFLSSSSKATPPTAGFGLVELLVSISVMVIVISVIVVRQSSFNSSILLRSQAFEVALQLRDIQLNAVSASFDSSGFRAVLGAHFVDDVDSNRLYNIFRDDPTLVGGTLNFYDEGEEFGLQGILDNRFRINDIRNIGGNYDDNGLSIVFERPNFDARFFDSAGEVMASQIEIDIIEVGGTAVRTVEVTSAGQISVR
jgi:hypothetical protein